MARSATINTTAAKKIINELEQLEELKKHILRLLPDGALKYGSKLWWEKEELMADEDVKKGRVYGPFDSANDFLKSLHKNIR